MFILGDILPPLQSRFSNTRLGRVRSRWFAHVLLACIIPFTSSMTSNLLRAVKHMFGMDVNHRRFYAFMASSKLPWPRLWPTLWDMIPEPETDGRLLLALDDCINPKAGKKVFGCSHVFDHAAKTNQSKYPWAQCVTSIGLLKRIKGRWARMPLAHRFYLPKKALAAGCKNMKVKGKMPVFRSKLEQAVDMLVMLSTHFSGMSILSICDSWFGNNGLLAPARKMIGDAFHLLSRLRSNITLYAMPQAKTPGQRGRTRKYGEKLGSTADMGARLKEKAESHHVFLYGKQREVLSASIVVMLKTLRCPVRVVFVYRRTQWVALFTTDLSLSIEQMIEFYGARWKIEAGFKEIKQDIGASRSQTRTPHAVMNYLNFCMMAVAVTWLYAIRLENIPERRHMIRGRSGFALSDVRHIIAQAALNEGFNPLCSKKTKPQKICPLQCCCVWSHEWNRSKTVKLQFTNSLHSSAIIPLATSGCSSQVFTQPYLDQGLIGNIPFIGFHLDSFQHGFRQPNRDGFSGWFQIGEGSAFSLAPVKIFR
ncbi:MAG: transposase [Mariprofundaceae bacterium]